MDGWEEARHRRCGWRCCRRSRSRGRCARVARVKGAECMELVSMHAWGAAILKGSMAVVVMVVVLLT